jgi:hypothetical protein
MICTADQWLDPTKINLVYFLPPQAIATVVGRTSRIATDYSENEQAAIRWWEVVGPPTLLSDCGYISADKNG